MREYQKKGALKISFTLYTYVLANILENGAKFRYAKAVSKFTES